MEGQVCIYTSAEELTSRIERIVLKVNFYERSKMALTWSEGTCAPVVGAIEFVWWVNESKTSELFPPKNPDAVVSSPEVLGGLTASELTLSKSDMRLSKSAFSAKIYRKYYIQRHQGNKYLQTCSAAVHRPHSTENSKY